MKCIICKKKVRDDGFCNNCHRQTTPKKQNSSSGHYFNIHGRSNKLNEIQKQHHWLQHKVETTSGLKKEEAQKKLDCFENKNNYFLNQIAKRRVLNNS